MSRSRLYKTFLLAWLGGALWLTYLRYFPHEHEPTVCLIKQVTHMPCPSCGSSRSVMSILDGHFSEAWQWNPLGYLLTLILFLCPGWIILDVGWKKNSFYRFYLGLEALFRVKWFSLTVIGLMLVNWIWNMMKHL